jgi:hypothetical protein
VSGLIDVEGLSAQPCGAQHYDAERSGSSDEQSAPGRGVVGTQSGPGQAAPSASLHGQNRPLRAARMNGAQNSHPVPRESVASYS